MVLFVGERFGDSAWQELLSGLSAADQQTLSSLVSIGWYELDLYMRLLVRLQSLYGERNPRLLEDYGRFSAQNDLTTTHKLSTSPSDT